MTPHCPLHRRRAAGQARSAYVTPPPRAQVRPTRPAPLTLSATFFTLRMYLTKVVLAACWPPVAMACEMSSLYRRYTCVHVNAHDLSKVAYCYSGEPSPLLGQNPIMLHTFPWKDFGSLYLCLPMQVALRLKDAPYLCVCVQPST